MDTLSRSVRGRPSTPDTRTRSPPSSERWMVVKSAIASGVMYSVGSPISYTSCSVTVAHVTRPPRSGCLVTTKLPPSSISTIG